MGEWGHDFEMSGIEVVSDAKIEAEYASGKLMNLDALQDPELEIAELSNFIRISAWTSTFCIRKYKPNYRS